MTTARTNIHSKREVFSNVNRPSLFEMAHKAGYDIRKLEVRWIDGERVWSVILNGKVMPVYVARKLIMNECHFYTFGGKPCEMI